MLDNLDVLMAVLQGIRTAEVEEQIAQCDLTERRKYVKVRTTEIAGVAAPRASISASSRPIFCARALARACAAFFAPGMGTAPR